MENVKNIKNYTYNVSAAIYGREVNSCASTKFTLPTIFKGKRVAFFFDKDDLIITEDANGLKVLQQSYDGVLYCTPGISKWLDAERPAKTLVLKNLEAYKEAGCLAIRVCNFKNLMGKKVELNKSGAEKNLLNEPATEKVRSTNFKKCLELINSFFGKPPRSQFRT